MKIKTEIRDEAAVQSACRRLHFPQPTRGKFELYSATESGLGIELPHWRYPIVANTNTGELRYDHFNGHWGSQEFLDQLLQMYAVEKAKIEARRQGHSVMEQRLEDGSMKLTVSVGGEA